jgi:molybdopterin/thiamine biosynthesis adenylyltransferase
VSEPGGGGEVSARVLLVGAGGIGSPAALALVEAGVRRFTVVDDDRVELTNLHRQILFRDEDVGLPKLEAFANAVRRRAPEASIETIQGRFRPDTAERLLAGAAVVLDATDNFASRFLIADACGLAGVPVVHAAAIRWRATVLTAAPSGRPCYRCLFEDLPEAGAPDCATAGVAGPVCGVAGAIAADRALRVLAGDASVFGRVVTFDGLRDRLREVRVAPRPGCPLCGDVRSIADLAPNRYETRSCFE